MSPPPRARSTPDPSIDSWSISSDSGTLGGSNCSADANNPSGEPANDYNDVNR